MVEIMYGERTVRAARLKFFKIGVKTVDKRGRVC